MRNKAFSLVWPKIRPSNFAFKGGLKKIACLYTYFLVFSLKNLHIYIDQAWDPELKDSQ